ncbi:MAG: acetylglutamate kinase [Candidatus Cryptobacteroides sp.]
MTRVIKIGGNVVDNPALLERFIKDFAQITGRKILVHGGGVMASQMQKALGMTPQMVQGRRVTDVETLKIVTMVYAGWCNKNITAMLQAEGCDAIGLSGADGNVITASRRKPMEIDGELVDYGFVGDVQPESVNADFLKKLMDEGIVPVLCAINHDGQGNLLNTNADTIASSVAVAVGENVELIYCFEKNGVLLDKEDDSSVIPVINPTEFDSLKEQGIIADGMIPKIENSFKAISQGVSSVTIKHSLNLLNGIGTTLQGE